MYSEYASRFLQQSRTRMSAIGGGQQPTAPLFFSAADHVPEEHDQDVQDIYVLKGSRRYFGAYASEHNDSTDGEASGIQSGIGKGSGHGAIRSSWQPPSGESSRAQESMLRSTSRDSKGKGKLVDVDLEGSDGGLLGMGLGMDDSAEMFGMNPDQIDVDDMHDVHNVPPEDITVERPKDRSPPPPRADFPTSRSFHAKQDFMPRPTEPHERVNDQPAVIPGQVSHPPIAPPAHDNIWAMLYTSAMGAMFATAFIVWLHTDDPSSKVPFGDAIYNTLHSSIHLLAVDSFLSVAVSLGWMFLLRSFVRPLIYLLLFSVPIFMTFLSIYPLFWSYQGRWDGDAPQDKAMRWSSLVPAIVGAGWVWMVYKGRKALDRAVGIIELACKILGENPSLVLLSFGTLVGLLVFTWVWFAMFSRVFLAGKNLFLDGKNIWIPSQWSWGLGAYFIIMYLWTLGVVSGIQRATSAATVSQWYFHRHATPVTDSNAILYAALHHSLTTVFGTICFSTLAALMVRLPILVLPRRVVGFIHLFCFNIISSPIAALTHPLTLTYAAIHSTPLISSSRQLASMRFIDASGFSGSTHHPRTAYRLSKMLLSATRAITAFTMGLVAWVVMARKVEGGSAYGYLVGMIAGAIGWGVLGVTEGALGCIVDAGLVCVGSEGNSGPGYCREAQIVFGG